jgi:hypothetical protein
MKNIFMIAVLAAVAGCSSMKTMVGYDKKVNFTGYKTYAWIPYPATQRADVRLDYDFLNQAIHTSVNDALRKKNVTEISSGEPDFRIRWYVAIDEDVTDTQVSSYYGFAGNAGWGYDENGQWDYTSPLYQNYQRTYTVGSLVIDFVDGKTGKLIWRGGAQSAVKTGLSREQRQQMIQEAVEKMLANFPPKTM